MWEGHRVILARWELMRSLGCVLEWWKATGGSLGPWFAHIFFLSVGQVIGEVGSGSGA